MSNWVKSPEERFQITTYAGRSRSFRHRSNNQSSTGQGRIFQLHWSCRTCIS